MNAARVFLVMVVTLALQTTLARFLPRGMAALDLVLVGVVYVAMTSGPVTGLFAGTVAGLAQDALSSGIIGIGGLAKTVIGFAAGRIGIQLIVTSTLARAVVFFGGTIVHGIVFVGMYRLLDQRPFPSPFVTVVEQAAVNALVGVVVFQVVELMPGALERRRATRLRR